MDEGKQNKSNIIAKFGSKKFSILFLSVGFIIVSTLAILFYKEQKYQVKIHLQQHLSTITDYKAYSIKEWLKNNFYNSAPIYNSNIISSHIEEIILHSNSTSKKEIQNIFDLERESKELKSITLFDLNGNILVSSANNPNEKLCDSRRNIDSAIASGKGYFTDFFFCKKDSTIHISYYLPIVQKEEGSQKALGVIALNTDPFTSLYPFIQYWPEKSRTAESLIVKAEGDSIIFINNLRFKKGAALHFKQPRTRNELPSVKAVDGIEGIVEGIDYRGAPVLACIKRIENSDWFIVAKMDKEEIFQPLNKIAVYIIFLAFVLISVLALALFTRLKGMQANLYHKLYKAEAEKNIIKTNFEQYFIYAGDMIFLLDENFNIVEANQKAAAELQYDHQDLIGSNGNILALSKNREQLKNELAIVENNGMLIETEMKRKDGTVFYTEAGIRKIEVDKKIFYQAILRNITDRISSTNEIKKLNKALQLISSCNRILVKANSENQLIQNICNIIIEKGGYDFAWMGYAVKDEMKHILPNFSSGNGNGFLNNKGFTWSENGSGNTPEGIAIRTGKIFISPDNDKSEFAPEWKNEIIKCRLASTIALPLFNHSEMIGILSISSLDKNKFDSREVVDILDELSHDLSYGILSIREKEKHKETEKLLKASEEKYRSFFEEDLTGDFTFTAHGKILMCNKAFAKILGINSVNDVKSYNLYDFYLEKDVLKSVIRTVKEKGRIENHETALRGVSGNTIHVVENMIGRYDEDGNLIEITGYLFNITDIKKAEEQLIIEKEKAEAANKIKSEFLAQMSHEIRTPLNSILTFSQLLETELVDKVEDEMKEGFEGLKRAGKRITRTIDSILNLSELHTGAYDYCPRIIDIHSEIIEDLHIEFFTLLKEKQINFSVDINTANTKVFADEFSTKQIFANLIDNAIKFTNSGSINIKTERNSDGKLTVYVSDTGIGIAEEYLSKLFTPFSQEEQGYTRPFEGNGLGLALVKRYCEVNNIEINVQSKKGAGTTFILTFLN